MERTLERLIWALMYIAYPALIVLNGAGQIALLATAPLVIAIWISRLWRNAPFEIQVAQILMFVFVTYVLLQTLLMAKSPTATHDALKIAIFAAAAPAVAHMLQQERVLLPWLAAMFGVVTLAFVYFTAKYGSVRLALYEDDVPFGAISNWMPATILPFVPIAIWEFAHRPKLRWLGGAVLVMALIIIFLSQSRFAYVCLPLMCAYFLVHLPMKWRLVFVGGAVTLGLAAFMLFSEPLTGLFENVAQRFLRFAPGLAEMAAIDDPAIAKQQDIRAIMREAGYEQWIGSWLFGFGFGGTKLLDLEIEGHPEGIISHNIYLDTGLYELGIVGFSLLMMLIVTVVMKPLQTWTGLYRRHDAEAGRVLAFILGLAVLLVHGWIRPQFDNPSFFVLFAMAGCGFVQPGRTAQETA